MARSRLVHKGKFTAEALENASPEFVKRLASEREARLAHMSPPEVLKLPPLLEQRRQEEGITDGAFSVQCMGDNVIVYQISRAKSETFEGTAILMAESTRKREAEQTPQGIIVGAGLSALDTLRMNGIDLGHVVTFCRVAPWRIETDPVEGKWDEVLLFQVGDIVGSVDLADSLREGRMRVRFDPEAYEHVYEDENGDVWHPRRSPSPEPDRSW